MKRISLLIQNIFLTIVLNVGMSISFASNMPKKILITGGAGFIGSNLAHVLLARGDNVVIIDNLDPYYDPKLKQDNLDDLVRHDVTNRLTVYKQDICNLTVLEEIISTEQPTHVCHLAARAGVRPSIERADLYFETNIIGTYNILEMVKKYPVQNLVIASSSSVYGDTDKSPFQETDQTDRPSSPYAATKKAAEIIAYTYHHLYNIPCTCLRFFTVYGPKNRPDMAVFQFLDAVHNNQLLFQYGDGTTQRDFTYVDDIVDGIIRALDRPFKFEIFNLGRGEPVMLKTFISLVEKTCNKKAQIVRKPLPLGDVLLTYADISKARLLLGYEPKTSLAEGLEKTYQWYLDNYVRSTNSNLFHIQDQ